MEIQHHDQQPVIKVTLKLTDQYNQPVEAYHYHHAPIGESKSPHRIITQLLEAGFTHFVHTTRPENVPSIVSMRKIVPGNKVARALYGDPLGKHMRIHGQLVTYNATRQSCRQLLQATGYRTPILLFPLSTILDKKYHLNKGYPFGHYVTFYTTDGKFFPSFRIDNHVDIQDLLTDPEFKQAHEVVLTEPELSIEPLEHLIISTTHQATLQVPPEFSRRITWVDPYPIRSDLPATQPYSANSPEIVSYALDHYQLSKLEQHQLFQREFPISK